MSGYTLEAGEVEALHTSVLKLGGCLFVTVPGALRDAQARNLHDAVAARLAREVAGKFPINNAIPRMGRITYRGRMSASDAHELLTVLNPGGRFGEVPVLVDALELSAFPPDARQVAAGFPIVYGPPRVIVIKDVVLRMVLTFVTRMQGLPLLSAPDLPRGVERIEAEWVRYQAGPRPSRLPRATEDPRSPGE